MMPSLVRVLLLAAFATTTFAVATPTPTSTARNVLDFTNPIDLEGLTNAQRFARGLSPNPPRRRSLHRVHKARQSPTPGDPTSEPTSTDPEPTSVPTDTDTTATETPTETATDTETVTETATTEPTATPTSACTPQSYVIVIPGAGPNAEVVYLGSPNSFGEFQPTAQISSAVTVTYCQDPDEGTFDVQVLQGGFSNFPYLAAIAGFANTNNNLGPGSFNYAYIGASTQVPSHSPAVTQPNSFSAAAGTPEGVETNIWTLTPGTNIITPKWVNPDGSVVSPTLLYVPSSNAFAITGDVASFSANFGVSQVVTFYLVAIQAAPTQAITTE